MASKPRHLFCSRRAWPRFYLYWSLRHSYLAKMRHYSLLEWIMLNLDLKTAISLKKLRKKQKLLFYKMSKYKCRILSLKNFRILIKNEEMRAKKPFLRPLIVFKLSDGLNNLYSRYFKGAFHNWRAIFDSEKGRFLQTKNNQHGI